ncbi:integrase/recombinase clustered with segregation and condensation protein B [Rhizobium leguminosarum bv. phaseoli CCGM1]|nr:integrase/recombinase clustered with segregation and condensation protein B [Rhizobium leguminosarum bv. phaseoli CCGM1]
MLLIGFAGGCADSHGRVEIFGRGMVGYRPRKRGWREVEIGRGSSDATCPVVALQTWLNFARIAHVPSSGGSAVKARTSALTRCSTRKWRASSRRRHWLPACDPTSAKLSRPKSSPAAGLASSAEADGRYVQKQLGHPHRMTRKYQRRRDRFRMNLTRHPAARFTQLPRQLRSPITLAKRSHF